MNATVSIERDTKGATQVSRNMLKVGLLTIFSLVMRTHSAVTLYAS
jgi:hypothetical protein